MPGVELPASQDPADLLAAVTALRRLADQLEYAAVEQAMRAGWSWPQVAEALGVTRQAVHKKHAKRLIAAGLELRRRGR
jgi:biotin operon repressor